MWPVVLICIGIVFENVKFGNARDFAVRMTNVYDSNSKQGRLEIFYNGSWGTVCDNYFTDASARVACASLGFGYEGSVIRDGRQLRLYTTGPIWLSEVSCTGTESGIDKCPHNGWGANTCSHNDDVSIRCDCGIRYFSGPTGHISSPNFPEQYAYGLDCYNYIAVLSRETIIVTFLVLNTENAHDWVKIICESGNASRSIGFSGSDLPPVLTLSSCNLLHVHFHSVYGGSTNKTGFSLNYIVTTDDVIGGLTTKPSNAFPRVDKRDPVIFNCTTTSAYLPWWTIYDTRPNPYPSALTDSACRVIGSSHRIISWFKAETLGPGSCNLIVVAPSEIFHVLLTSVVCTDSTLASARAILAPINLELRVATGMNSLARVTDFVRDEEISISCNGSFININAEPSLVFTGTTHRGGPVVLVRILRIYLTSHRNDTSNTSSYVLDKAPEDGVIPSYTCNIVCDFYTNISDLAGDSTMELSFSTDPIDVLYWPTEENMVITGHDDGHIRTSAPLKCSANVNPTATYTWIDESNGNTINGSTINITHSGKYTCNASNIIRGQFHQHSKSITLQATEDKTTQNPVALVLLGVSVLTIIIILAIIVICLCRQQKRTTENGKEYELPQRGGESNLYDGVVESEYDKPDDIRRCLPAIPSIYDEIADRDYGQELGQPGGCNHYESAKENEIDVKESDYECPDELEFDK